MSYPVKYVFYIYIYNGKKTMRVHVLGFLPQN